MASFRQNLPALLDLRSTLELGRASAEVVKGETFESFNTGRRIRSWLRFIHIAAHSMGSAK